jgi:hypothetical protein
MQQTGAAPYPTGISPLGPYPRPMRLEDNGILNPISMNGLANLVNFGHESVGDTLIELSQHLDAIAAAVKGIALATAPAAQSFRATHAVAPSFLHPR